MHGFNVNHISKVGTVSGSTANFPTLTEEEEEEVEDAGDGPNNTTMAAPRTPHGSVLGWVCYLISLALNNIVEEES